jgi:hypothetical protein
VTTVWQDHVARLPLAALLLAMACPAAFAGEGVAVPAPGTQVEITVVGRASEFRWARSLVGASSPAMASARWTRVERFEVREIFEIVGAARENLLACWLDLSDPRRGRLYFVAPSGQRFLLRDVELSGHQTEVDRASLAEVLELSVGALLENERTGLTRSEAETLLADRAAAAAARSKPLGKPEPAPMLASSAVTAPASPSTLLLGLGALFAEQVLSADFPLGQRVGIEVLAGRYRGSAWLAGFVAGEYQFPVTTKNAEIGLRLQALSPHAGLEAGHLRPRPGEDAHFWLASLFGRLGVGVDFARVSPQPGTQAVPITLAAAHGSSSLVVRGTLGSSWALGRRIAMDVRLFADIVPTAVHYNVSVGGDVRGAFSPWRVRPGLVLALCLR